MKRITSVGKSVVQSLKQIPVRLKGAPDGLPIPPSNLLRLVAGTDDITWFLEGGRLGAESITSILKDSGVDARTILDFGCGCGRVIRHFHSLKNVQLYGTDYNTKLIEWSRQNLTFAQFATNHLEPPLDFPDGTFDLVYALSVFTHMPQMLQHQWMKELGRVIKPGGYLLITTHGEFYLNMMLPDEQSKFRSGQLVVRSESQAGTNTCATFHPQSYIREKLAKDYNVIAFVPEGAKGNPRQDVFLLQKPRIL